MFPNFLLRKPKKNQFGGTAIPMQYFLVLFHTTEGPSGELFIEFFYIKIIFPEQNLNKNKEKGMIF